jgi:hypothetical protein
MTMSLLAGGISSLFGPKPKLTAGQKIQLDIARRMQQMGNAAPMSNADELAGLAQQRAMLGNEQSQATGQILGAMPAYARTNTVDMEKNLASSQAGERGALDMQAIAESIARNRQALLSAGQMAGSVGAPGQMRENGIPQLMGQLAQTYFQQQAMKQANAQNNGRVPAGGGGGSGQVAQVGGPSWFPGMPQPGVQTIPTAGAPKAPAVSTGPQSGMSGMLGAFGQMLGGNPLAQWGVSNSQQQDYLTNNYPSAPPAADNFGQAGLGMMNQQQAVGALTPPGWDLSNSNWNQVQRGTFGPPKKRKASR